MGYDVIFLLSCFLAVGIFLDIYFSFYLLLCFFEREPLLEGLASKGHRVDVVSHFAPKNLEKLPNYHHISIDGSLPPSMNNIKAENLTMVNSISFKHLMRMAGDGICDLLDLPELQKLIHNPPSDPPYDAVIFEVQFHFLFIF